MLRTSNQNYLCKPGETVLVDSKNDGGALSFTVDNVPVAGPSFQFNLPNAAGASRQLGGVLIGPAGTRAGIRIRLVTNRPNNMDVTILAIAPGSNHAATIWDFTAANDSTVIDFAGTASTSAGKAKSVKKTAKKAAKKSKKPDVERESL